MRLGLNISSGETEAIFVYLGLGATQNQRPPRLRALEQHLSKIKLNTGNLFLVCLLAGKTLQLGMRRFTGGPFLPAPFTQPRLVPDTWSSSAPCAWQQLTLAVPWLVAGCRSRRQGREAEGCRACRVAGLGWGGRQGQEQYRERRRRWGPGPKRDAKPSLPFPAQPTSCLPALGQGCPTCLATAEAVLGPGVLSERLSCSSLCRDG